MRAVTLPGGLSHSLIETLLRYGRELSLRRAALYALVVVYYVYTRVEPDVYAIAFLYVMTLYLAARFFKRFGLFGTLVAGFGKMLNAIVVIANGGYMPTFSAEHESRLIWRAVDESTVLPQLADGYFIPLASIGDVICLIGAALIAGELAARFILRRIRRRGAESPDSLP